MNGRAGLETDRWVNVWGWGKALRVQRPNHVLGRCYRRLSREDLFHG